MPVNASYYKFFILLKEWERLLSGLTYISIFSFSQSIPSFWCSQAISSRQEHILILRQSMNAWKVTEFFSLQAARIASIIHKDAWALYASYIYCLEGTLWLSCQFSSFFIFKQNITYSSERLRDVFWMQQYFK